jgi:peptidyl-prolyl cis-trans isomerase C
MNSHRTLISVVLVASLGASAAHAAATDVLATVNGTSITQRMFDIYAKQRGVEDTATLPAERKAQLVDELINRELLYRAAVEKKLDKNADTSAELESAKLNILAGASVRAHLDKQPEATDEALKKDYDQMAKEGAGLEYKTRHILVDSEDKAAGIIAELEKGGDFAKLVETNSAAGTEGGELEWFQPRDMVKSFAEATAQLEKGAYTKKPVQTQYGWHVIQLMDTRPVTPPPFDEVKGQLRMRARNASIETYLKSLREKAKIERK